MKFIFFIFLMLLDTAHAEVKEFNLDLLRLKDYRDPYYPGKDDFKSYVGLNWNVGAYDRLFWDNTVFMYSDSYQVRNVGWKFDAGLKLTDNFSLIYHHLSRHDLDHAREDLEFGGNRPKFPIENSFGVRVDFKK